MALRITSSSVVIPEGYTSFEIYGRKYFKNHSNRNSGGILALINLFLLRHS